MKGIFLDTETGGLTPATDALCSIGLVAFDLSLPLDGCILDEMVWDIRVPMDSKLLVHPRALEVQGVTRDLLAHSRRWDERRAMEDFAAAVYDFHRTFRDQAYAWNAPFDAGFLEAALERHHVACDPVGGRVMLCARQLAMNLHAAGVVTGPTARDKRVSSLEKWAPLYGLSQPSPHNAVTDAILGTKILWHLVRAIGGPHA